MIYRSIFVIISLFLVACQPANQEPETIPDTFGEVASAHPLATQAGLDILEQGGNAFDAAIAVAATLNVVEPMMSGIGGYGTTLVYDADADEIQFLNSSGKFPAATNTDLMRAPTPNFMANRVGPKSISTPGNLNAWAAMHEKYGSLPWADLFEPAIQYSEEGHLLNPYVAGMIRMAFDDFSDYAKSFYGKNGQPLEAGDTLRQQDLANTFRTIAENGPEPFYQGEIARAIDQKMQETGSFLNLIDLQQNEAEWWDPIYMDYHGYRVYTASLPANSFAAFMNLGLMSQFPEGSFDHNSPQYLHLFAEMAKESYKARLAYSFDPDVQVAPLDSIFSDPVLAQMASELNPEVASEFEPPFSKESKNTTHFVVADEQGNIVSATQTLGNVFGSRIMVDGTGIWMNNSMAYSTFDPKGNPMDAFPGRHKLSGDCPVIIMKDGESWAALGSPGGHTITQNVPQIIFNLIDYNMSMQEAIDAPKLAFVEPDRIRVDEHMPQRLIEALRGKGHKVSPGRIGNAHGIKVLRDPQGQIMGFETGVDKRSEVKVPMIDR